MILDLKESLDLCDWLIGRGLGLGEAAQILSDITCGYTFSLALIKVFMKRETKITMEKIHDKKFSYDWSNPITP